MYAELKVPNDNMLLLPPFEWGPPFEIRAGESEPPQVINYGSGAC